MDMIAAANLRGTRYLQITASLHVPVNVVVVVQIRGMHCLERVGHGADQVLAADSQMTMRSFNCHKRSPVLNVFNTHKARRHECMHLKACKTSAIEVATYCNNQDQVTC